MQRRVLLALRPVSPVDRLFTVGAALSRRMGAELEVLADPAHPHWAEIVVRLSALNRSDLDCRLTPMPGIDARQVVEYARGHESIVSVVVGCPRAWNNAGADNQWARLECPLVEAAELLAHTPEI